MTGNCPVLRRCDMTMTDAVENELRSSIKRLETELSEVKAKCDKCPFVIAAQKNQETTKQVLIICLGILGAIVGFKVVPQW